MRSLHASQGQFLFAFLFKVLPLVVLFADWLGLGLSASGQSVYSEAYDFTTFAGSASAGIANGAGSYAQFNFPGGVAVDSASNI